MRVAWAAAAGLAEQEVPRAHLVPRELRERLAHPEQRAHLERPEHRERRGQLARRVRRPHPEAMRGRRTGEPELESGIEVHEH